MHYFSGKGCSESLESMHYCIGILNYILADTQAFLSKRHRQQNNEILIRHSPGIGECFLFLSIQLTEKIKKFHQGAVKMPLSVSFYVRVFLTGKNKRISSRACIPSSFEYV